MVIAFLEFLLRLEYATGRTDRTVSDYMTKDLCTTALPLSGKVYLNLV